MASSESEGEHYEAAEVLGQRKRGRNIEYLVKWKGLDDDENSWEAARNLRHAKELVESFLKKDKKVTSTDGASKETLKRRSSSRGAGSTKTTTTKTTTVVTTKSRSSGAVSESSSPESSPLLPRRSMTRSYEVSQVKSSSTKPAASRSMFSCCSFMTRMTNCTCCQNLSRKDIPIMIVIACYLFIFLSFACEQK